MANRGRPKLPRLKFPAGDAIGRDMRELANKMARISVLETCVALLERLQDGAVPHDASPTEKASRLRGMMQAALDEAFAERIRLQRGESSGLPAVDPGDVLAAGAVMGLVTGVPESAAIPPSQMMGKATEDKAARQGIAAQWLGAGAVNSPRGFRDYEEHCLVSFWRYLSPRLETAEGVAARVPDDQQTAMSSESADETLTSALPEASAVPAAADNPPGVDERPRSYLSRWRPRKGVIGTAAVTVLVLVLGLTFTLNREQVPPPKPSPSNPSATPSDSGPPSSPASTTSPGQTLTEVAFFRGGIPTFKSPYSLSQTGQKIKFEQKVQVSCKLLAETVPSVSPDGYWYRIASAPWNNQYFAAANSFLNGDPVQGPYTHQTDFRVPDCPPSVLPASWTSPSVLSPVLGIVLN